MSVAIRNSRFGALSLALVCTSACAQTDDAMEVMLCQFERATEYVPSTDDFKTDGVKRPLVFKFALTDNTVKDWARARTDSFDYYDPYDLFQGNRVYTLGKNLVSGSFGTIAEPDAENSVALVVNTQLAGTNSMITARGAGKPRDPSMVTHVGSCTITKSKNADQEFERAKASYELSRS